MAGFFDGEGCIMWHSRSPTVALTATWPGQLAHFVGWFGGTVRSRGKPKAGIKHSYHWRLFGNKAVEFCRVMLPYLEEKQEQARLLLVIKDTPPKDRPPLVKELARMKRVSYEGAAEEFEKVFKGE